MESLPKEILERILSYPTLSSRDILNVGAASKYLHQLVQQNGYLWKNQFHQSYPQFLNLINTSLTDWYTEMKCISDLRQSTHSLLSILPLRSYKDDDLPENTILEWYGFINDSIRHYHYLMWILMNITKDPSSIKTMAIVPIATPGNRTFQYYAQKVLQIVRRRCLTLEWQQFIQLPEPEQILEKCAVFIAQWCQPFSSVEYEDFAKQLDALAQEVIFQVYTLYPNHPLLQIPIETFRQWKLYRLDANQWNEVECQQLTQSIQTVLYTFNEFIADYTNSSESSYINQVLYRKLGSATTLAVIYESVARRVGLKCEPCISKALVVLKFTEGKDETRGHPYYINAFESGDILSSDWYNTEEHDDFEVATVQEVTQKMVNNLKCYCFQHAAENNSVTSLKALSIMELDDVINDKGLNLAANSIKTTARITYKNNHAGILRMAESRRRSKKRNRVGLRFKDLKYAVGMVMQHCRFQYKCVIYGWNQKCKLGVKQRADACFETLKYGFRQPFYSVLTDNGQDCYVPQEDLRPTFATEKLKSQEKLGKYFSHFFITHFVPNPVTEDTFPFDGEVRQVFHEKWLDEHS